MRMHATPEVSKNNYRFTSIQPLSESLKLYINRDDGIIYYRKKSKGEGAYKRWDEAHESVGELQQKLLSGNYSMIFLYGDKDKLPKKVNIG